MLHKEIDRDAYAIARWAVRSKGLPARVGAFAQSLRPASS